MVYMGTVSNTAIHGTVDVQCTATINKLEKVFESPGAPPLLCSTWCKSSSALTTMQKQ